MIHDLRFTIYDCAKPGLRRGPKHRTCLNSKSQMENSKSRMVLVLGVTASGKARLGFDLARALDGEILSIDSMKVYRRMDIGTAKPSPEARRQVRYHLIDVVEPSESFSVGLFLDQALAAIDDIRRRGKAVIAVGGTALYIKALLYGLFEGPGGDERIRAELRAQAAREGLPRLHEALRHIDPEAAGRISRHDARRIIRALEVHRLTGKPISSLQTQFDAPEPRRDWTILGLRRDKALESQRINVRVRTMIELGLVGEVRALRAEERPLSRQARSAIGYAEIIDHLEGRLDLEEAVERIKVNTRRLAKGQRTWFKTFRQVYWLHVGPEEPPEHILERARELIADPPDRSVP
jgi:tRNA dimethylallyltransferase